MQKAGVHGIPGCVEHAFAIWDAMQKSKEEKGELSVVWLDLANAYGSVPHKLLKMAMEHFWIPEEIQKLMMKYYDNFMMRFTVGDFTTEWQRLEIGIAAGCTISVIWFILVMEMVIRSTETNGAEIKTGHELSSRRRSRAAARLGKGNRWKYDTRSRVNQYQPYESSQ